MRAPLFVFGVPRSGTTLTYSLLLSSGSFPVYEAESRLMECASRYGPLRSSKNRQRFLADFFESRQFVRSGLTKEEVAELASRRNESWPDFLDGFMSAISRKQGKLRWVEKSPNNVNFVHELRSYYPEARFLHIVRDGRSVVASQRSHGMGEKYSSNPWTQLVWIANVWRMQVKAGCVARAFDDAYLEIKYEDLVQDVPGMLERIGDFAGIDLDIARVEASEVGALGGANTAFAMERGGVSRQALERWRDVLSPKEISLLNWLLGDTLKELGYPVATPVPAPALSDRITAWLSDRALEWKHTLNLGTPLGRFARKPLEIGLS